MLDVPFVNSVFHPSDFSESSRAAFAHALAIVLYYRSALTVHHVVSRDEPIPDWMDSPSVHGTLERWGMLRRGRSQEEVFGELKLWVRKIDLHGEDPLRAVLDELDLRPTDLVVLANDGRSGVPAWVKSSIAGGGARDSTTMTLFVPSEGRGFVSLNDGVIALRRILVSVDHGPNPSSVLACAARAAVMSTADPVEIGVLHVGSGSTWPDLSLPDLRSCCWHRLDGFGDPAEQIVTIADRWKADLIVTGFDGRGGILGALREDATERVLRRASCPMLAVPVNG